MNETPDKAESLHAIAHNLKELVEEVRKLNEEQGTVERLSQNG